jgi:recombination protein RecA
MFINQLRMKIGVMFGSPETTTGGHALKYYASVRLDIRRIGPVKNGEEICGNRTRVKVVKNKLAPPFQLAEFDILYGSGIDAMADLLDMAVAQGVIEKRGAYLALDGETLAQGREKARDLLANDSALRERLRQRIANHKPAVPSSTPEATAEAAPGAAA